MSSWRCLSASLLSGISPKPALCGRLTFRAGVCGWAEEFAEALRAVDERLMSGDKQHPRCTGREGRCGEGR